VCHVPRELGLYGFLGLGSRGVLWSGLGGECLAAQIAGEPCSVEQDILEALDPARWVFRAAGSVGRQP
jgi:tRNA 5-methylaminomethyl-2-thiouridine biosynthesis bifunctional protein